MPGVCDGEATSAQEGDFAWKGERRRGGCFGFECCEGGSGERACLFCFCEGSGDYASKVGLFGFAALGPNDTAIRIENYDSGPSLYLPRPPDCGIGVDRHGMVDAIGLDD